MEDTETKKLGRYQQKKKERKKDPITKIAFVSLGNSHRHCVS